MVTPIRAPALSPPVACWSTVFSLEPQAAMAAVRTTAVATAANRVYASTDSFRGIGYQKSAQRGWP